MVVIYVAGRAEGEFVCCTPTSRSSCEIFIDSVWSTTLHCVNTAQLMFTYLLEKKKVKARPRKTPNPIPLDWSLEKACILKVQKFKLDYLSPVTILWNLTMSTYRLFAHALLDDLYIWAHKLNTNSLLLVPSKLAWCSIIRKKVHFFQNDVVWIMQFFSSPQAAVLWMLVYF